MSTLLFIICFILPFSIVMAAFLWFFSIEISKRDFSTFISMMRIEANDALAKQAAKNFEFDINAEDYHPSWMS